MTFRVAQLSFMLHSLDFFGILLYDMRKMRGGSGTSNPLCHKCLDKNEENRTLSDPVLFGAADGSRTRTPIRTQAPQACQSTNSSTAAKRGPSQTAFLLYCLPADLSTVFYTFSFFSAAMASRSRSSSSCSWRVFHCRLCWVSTALSGMGGS